MAIEAAKTGDRIRALALLDEVLQLDPGNEVALMWKSGLTPDRQEAMWCLRRVLASNPNHARARAGLAWLQQKEAEEEASREQAATAALQDVSTASLARDEHDQPPLRPQGATDRLRSDLPYYGTTEPEDRDLPGLLPEPVREDHGEGGKDDRAAALRISQGPREPTGPAPLTKDTDVAATPEDDERMYPSLVDELRSGVVSDTETPRGEATSRDTGLGPGRWLILLLLITSVCGVGAVGTYLVLGRGGGTTDVPDPGAVAETQQRLRVQEGEAILSPPLSETSSGDLNLIQVRYLPGQEGEPFRMLGEVQSQTPKLVGELRVDLTLKDESGATIATQMGFVPRRVLTHGGRSPFEVLLSDVPDWAYYSVRLAGESVAKDVLDVYPEIAVVEHSGKDLGNGRYRIEGEVENLADYPSHQIEVVTTLYADPGELIVAVAVGDTQGQVLEAGGRASFVVEAEASGWAVSGYRLFAQGVRLQP
jgi:hypothetical protein